MFGVIYFLDDKCEGLGVCVSPISFEWLDFLKLFKYLKALYFAHIPEKIVSIIEKITGGIFFFLKILLLSMLKMLFLN